MSSSKANGGENIQRENGLFSSLYVSDILKGIRKFWWLCIVLVAVFGGYKFYKSYVKFVPSYSSSVTFTIGTQKTTVGGGGISSYSFYYDTAVATQLADTFPYILSSNLLYDAIKEDLDIEYVPVSLSASSVSGSNMFTIYAKGTDAQMTYDVLMSAVENYPDVAKYVLGNIKFTMITEPTVPTVPTNRSKYKNDTTLGVVVGFMLWVVLIVLYALQRKTIRTRDDIKTTLNKRVIGTLPSVTFKKYKKEIDRRILLTNERVGKGFLESLRVLRNTFVHSLDKDSKVVMVTSTAPGEGKTTVTVNLALSLADLGKRVLLVEADLRNPSILKCMGIEHDTLDFYRENDFSVSKTENESLCYLELTDKNGRLWKYIDCDRLRGVLDRFRDEFDCILIDTPPCGLISDTLLTAQETDAVLYVILQDTIRISKIRNGIENLYSTGANLMGCVLNAAMSGASGYGENYGYGYGYGYKRYGYGYSRYGYDYGYGKDKSKRRRRSKKEE